MTDNKHPVDELFAVRRYIARLEKREKELKQLVIDMVPAERQGRDAEAAVVTSERTALDTKAVKDEMGEEWFAARSKTTQVTTLKVREL